MARTTKVTPERSEAREALAAAIDEAAAAAQSAENARAAIARATELASKARGALDAARGKSTAAKEARTALIVSAATSGEALTQDGASRDARREVNEAADELEAAEAALDAVKEACDPSADIYATSSRKRKCVDAIILAEAKRQMDEVEKLARPLAEKIAGLRFMAGAVDYGQNIEIIQKIDRFQRQFVVPHHIANQSVTERDAWAAAVRALESDADAELPE